MLKIKGVLKNLFFSLFLIGFASCELFQNDVSDFMERYTTTAAIEDHEFNVVTYNDASEQLCIGSSQDSEILFFLRNPKRFTLTPAVTFEALDPAISRSLVQISQTDPDTITLSLPQEFLVPADEGKDITAQIDLCEAETGRSFESYTVDLHCNTIPPVILNPTVLNNDDSTFVLAFDMPSPEEVALRHKDITELVINGHSYPVTISTVADSTVEGVYKAVYTISDPKFSRSFSSDYSFINSKTFTHNADTSFYFATGDIFNQGKKEYTLMLKDSAGLYSQVKAATAITKLSKPVIKDMEGTVVAEGNLTAVPYNEETGMASVTIVPPTTDHLGQTITGARVYYKICELTGNGRVYASGSAREAVTVEFPQNTYRVEAYAALPNCENSATTQVRFRVKNNAIYVRASANPAGYVGGGTEAAPYESFAEAIADINSRDPRGAKYTINLEGDFTTTAYGDLVLSTIETDELVIRKNPKVTSAKIKSLKLENTLAASLKVSVDGLEISGAASSAIINESGLELTLKNNAVSGAGSYGLDVSAGNVILESGTISANGSSGVNISGGQFTVKGGTISGNTSWGIYQTGGTINLRGGNITGNLSGGISANNTIKVSGNPIVYDNYTGATPTRCDVELPSGNNIIVDGQLTSGCKIGVKLDSGRTPVAIGDIYDFTSGYSNTDSPSNYFVSNGGFAVIRVSATAEASVALAGSSGTFPYSIDDFNFSYAISTNSATEGTAQTVTITPTLTRSEMTGATTSLTYNSTDHKLYAGSVAATDETLTISAGLYDGAVRTDVFTITYEANGDWSFTIPGKLTGTYIIKLNVMFFGENCGTTFVYNVAAP